MNITNILNILNIMNILWIYSMTWKNVAKIVVTFEPIIQFWCPSRFRILIPTLFYEREKKNSNHLVLGLGWVGCNCDLCIYDCFESCLLADRIPRVPITTLQLLWQKYKHTNGHGVSMTNPFDLWYPYILPSDAQCLYVPMFCFTAPPSLCWLTYLWTVPGMCANLQSGNPV